MENNQSLKNVSNRGLSLTTPNGGEQPWKTTRKSETQGRKPVTELTETGVDELGFSEYNVDSDEYEIIHKDVEDDEGGGRDLCSYNFPGTWESAYHETTKVAIEIKKASKTYYRSVTESGITKAGWSIVGALASTTNRSALLVANYAVEASGVDCNRLPGPLSNWLKRKEVSDEAKRQAEEAEYVRPQRRLKTKLIASDEVRHAPYQYYSQIPSGFIDYSEDSPDCLSDVSIDSFREIHAERGRLGCGHLETRRFSSNLAKFEPGGDGYAEQSIMIPKKDINPRLRTGMSISPITPLSFGAFQSQAVTGQSQASGFPFETPPHATGVFKYLETPDTVRHQLAKPLNGGSPFRPPPLEEKVVESPYSTGYASGMPTFGLSTPISSRRSHMEAHFDDSRRKPSPHSDIEEDSIGGGSRMASLHGRSTAMFSAIAPELEQSGRDDDNVDDVVSVGLP